MRRRAAGLSPPEVTRSAGAGAAPRRAVAASALTLADLAPGQSAEVVAVETTDWAASRRLYALGLVPGATLTVKQCFPTFVFTVGHTTIAVDREMALGIGVAKTGGPGGRPPAGPRPPRARGRCGPAAPDGPSGSSPGEAARHRPRRPERP